MTANQYRAVDVTEDDLPLHCPTPEMTTWDSHPRVFLPIEESEDGEFSCPYCGILYRLKQRQPRAS
ncbi:zinc-finger domain-containing protein [Thiohalorhabdus denitrificans]|uniref:Zinc-finger domain-containing protein n=1 Tax=Thiohalorhabdus denitrificans TaxID=381306 RepID=A0A1G5ECW2_9GAMM|nr:zinc-finger domain-containing protein [Thiohalorhabdus denitrificans]SCY24755.1 Zinc-finger domain-containing protein [Thiohalorhabdus denitrificans]